MFDNLKTDDTIKSSGDVIGGYQVLESGLYDFTVEMAYIDYSKKTNAMSFNLHLKGDNGEMLRTEQWVASGDAKGNKNYYLDKKTEEKKYLPGFVVSNDIALLAAGKNLNDLDFEDKALKLWDSSQGKETTQTKKVATNLIGAQITLGVLKENVDKNVDVGGGNYQPTGETRDQNEIDKAFRRADGFTVLEITAESSEPVFKQKWADKNTGITRMNAKGAGAGAPVSKMNVGNAQSAQAADATVSMFAVPS